MLHEHVDSSQMSHRKALYELQTVFFPNANVETAEPPQFVYFYGDTGSRGPVRRCFDVAVLRTVYHVQPGHQTLCSRHVLSITRVTTNDPVCTFYLQALTDPYFSGNTNAKPNVFVYLFTKIVCNNCIALFLVLFMSQ